MDNRKFAVGRLSRDELDAHIAIYDVNDRFVKSYKKLREQREDIIKIAHTVVQEFLLQQREMLCTVNCSANRKKLQDSEDNKKLAQTFINLMEKYNENDEFFWSLMRDWEKAREQLKSVYDVSDEF